MLQGTIKRDSFEGNNELGSKIFYVSLAINLVTSYFLCALIESTAITRSLRILMLLSAGGACLSFFLSRISRTQQLFSILIILSCVIAYYYSRDSAILILGFFVCGAANADVENIMKIYMFFITASTLAIIVLSKLSVIPTRIMNRTQDGIVLSRDSLGFNHPNALAAALFTITIAFLYLFSERYVALSYLVLLAAFSISYFICNSRTYSYALLFLAILFILNKTDIFRKLSKYIAFTVLIVLLFLSFYLPAMYGKTEWSYTLNELTSGRIRLSNVFFENYSITFFGQKIDYVSTDYASQSGLDSLILDNSFLHILFSFGIFAFIIILVCLFTIFRKIHTTFYEANYLYIVFASVILCAFFETLLYKVYINPLILLVFARNTSHEEINNVELNKLDQNSLA